MIAAFTSEVRAGLLDDSITYDILVVDENSRPVPGATVWVQGDDRSRTDLQPVDLARLVRRYSADVDFVFVNSFRPGFWVLRAGEDGKTQLKLEDTEVHGLKRVRTSFAGLKRGYQPMQADGDAPNNSRRKIILRLQAAPADKVDPRMEELYRIRALAAEDEDAPMAMDRRLRLQEFEARLRTIAADLERDSHFDEAAAVYYNLAFLPSVDVVKDESGAVIVRGYTSGFDEREPRRVADRKRAWQLARNHPMLEYDAMADSYTSRGLMVTAYEKDAPLRRAYIADTEAMIERYGDRLWPWAYGLLWRMHNANLEFEAGCRSLRAFHAFDPSYFDAAGWARMANWYETDIRMRKGPSGATCELTDPGRAADAMN